MCGTVFIIGEDFNLSIDTVLVSPLFLRCGTLCSVFVLSHSCFLSLFHCSVSILLALYCFVGV